MKTIVYTKYGPPDVLQLKEAEKPTPKDNEVLIKVYATTVTTGDVNARGFVFIPRGFGLISRLVFGIGKPKKTILGVEFAGDIEATGKDVTLFQKGDQVFGIDGAGSFAEYVPVPESALALKPSNVSFEEAAATPLAAVTALQGLRDDGHIQPGQKVLINGASGGVGSFAVQIAKSFGAEVTAVCSTRNVDMVRSLGADHVNDYKKEDFTRNRQQYDLILAVNGYHPISAYKRALTPKGNYVMAGGLPAQMFQSLLLGTLTSESNGRKMTSVSAKTNPKDLAVIKDLLEAGKIVPVIDDCYPLSKTADAFR